MFDRVLTLRLTIGEIDGVALNKVTGVNAR
jgi:hypothetical protein